MSEQRASRLDWAPPFLVGAATGMAAEVGASLLLYAGPGLARSLSVLLATASIGFGVGLWAAPSGGPGIVDRLRRRWVFCLFAYLAAATFGVLWSLPVFLPQSRATQALGISLLVALPLFSSGAVLGGLGNVGRPGGMAGRVGGAAALGAAMGFVATGLLLPRTPVPGALLLTCLIFLSLGGLLFGITLAGSTSTVVVEEHGTPQGDVRVEDVTDVRTGRTERRLVEGTHVRARSFAEGADADAWEVVVGRRLSASVEGSSSVLCLGCGASRLPKELLASPSPRSLRLIERAAEVVRLGAEYFDTGLAVGNGDRLHVSVGNVEDQLRSLRDRYDVVLVDGAGLALVGGARGISREARGRIVQAVAERGILVWGGEELEADLPELAASWRRRSYRRDASSSERSVTVMWPGGAPPLPEEFDGFESDPDSAGRSETMDAPS